jgi:hypothetical protein
MPSFDPMTPAQKKMLARLAESISAAQTACRELVNSLEPLSHDAIEYAYDMDEALKALGDDSRPDHSSGLMCMLHTALTEQDCEECGAPIPLTEPDMVNRKHRSDCSLHSDNVVEAHPG